MTTSERRQSGLWSRNPDTGFYEQVSAAPKAQITGNFYNAPHVTPAGPYHYYQPPPRASNDQGKRSFSDRTANATDASNGLDRDHGRKQRSNTLDDAKRHVNTTSHHHAQTRHVNSTAMPGSSKQPPLRVDPGYVPTNVRNKPWSPDLASPRTTTDHPPQASKVRQPSNASNVSELVRRGSVPDRSPLQNLETWSKEEKRAKLEQAEQKARQSSIASGGEDPGMARHGTVRSEKGRVVSDPNNRRPSQKERPRNASNGQAEDGARRFRHARDALLRENISPTQQNFDHNQTAPVANQGKIYDRQTPSMRRSTDDAAPRGSTDLGRSDSRKYRAKNAGFAGAEAAAYQGPTIADMNHDSAAAERGKAVHDRRRSQIQTDAARSPVSPMTSDAGQEAARSGSEKVQKRSPQIDEYGTRQQLQTDRMGGLSGSKKERQVAEAHLPADPVPRASVEMPHPQDGVRYAMPPQTANAQQAREQVGFAAVDPPAQHEKEKHHRGFRDFFHRGHDHRGYQASQKPLDDWRQATPAVLTAEDIEFEQSAAGASRESKDSPWWEKNRRSSSSGSKQVPDMAQYDGPYEEKANGFQPRLFLKCGPLLRYTGIRKQTIRNTRTNQITEREVWKGTIMIVTEDDQSDFSSPPTLRLFAQPMDLHQPPPPHLLDTGHELSPEFEDPVAGQVKLSRTGRALYVRPVHDIDGGIDLSREENNQGLYSAVRTPLLGPQNSVGADGRVTPHITFQDKSRIKKRDGEWARRYRDTRAIRLHSERGYTFWRFSLEIELASREARVAYRINKGPAIGFWVPARGQSMHIMFHSCNGFSLSVDSDTFSGPDPLWRDVLNRHQARPFHVMIGGGDQVYNDAAMRDTELFKEWLQTKNPQSKHEADFSPEMQTELELFYLHRYAMWFSQGLFGMANSQIPMVNIWDDHDIIDGYGSYPHHFQSTRVFTGLGAVAFKYYMLFQHQSVSAETEKEEPSWLLGKSPGPYINERSRSLFMSLGRHVALLGLDCRTERMRDEILSQETYDAVFDRCRAELVKGETKHLIVLLGVPIAYPRLNFLENILTSRVMDPVKAVGRTGMLGGFVNKFDGGVEILDDLDDHWTAKHHKAERNWFIQELQELAAEKSVRITILGGDVHLGAIGQFFSNPKLGLPKDKDHRYMPNVISSAIVNTPPPTMMADVLNKRNKIHHLDAETDENMIPMFSHDVDGSRRNNNHLLPRRNFAVIREYFPGSTPPSTPKPEHRQPATPMPQTFDGADEQERARDKDRRFPPGSMKRTMSLTRGPMNLVRRLSGSKKTRPPISLPLEHTRPYNEEDRRSNSIQRSNSLSAAEGRSYFPHGPEGDLERRPTFKRRPTNFSEKDARRISNAAGKRGDLDGAADEPEDLGHVDLEGGLDISLCMEADQQNPLGTTVPYRLLVPALWYEGSGDVNTQRFSSHRKSLMDRLRFNRKREAHVDGTQDQQRSDFVSDGSRTPSPPPNDHFDPATEKNTALNANPNHQNSKPAADALGLSSTGRGAYKPSPQPPKNNTHSNQGDYRAPHQSNGIDAYNQGYNLSSPPIGLANATPRALPRPPQPHAQSQYPQSGYRRPLSSGNNGPYGRSPPTVGGYDGYSSEGSEESEPPQKKGSKAERFLGIGGGEKKMSLDTGRAAGGGGKRSLDQGRDRFWGREGEGEREGEGGLGRSQSQKRRGWKGWLK